jgi:hypothetical protein
MRIIYLTFFLRKSYQLFIRFKPACSGKVVGDTIIRSGEHYEGIVKRIAID